MADDYLPESAGRNHKVSVRAGAKATAPGKEHEQRVRGKGTSHEGKRRKRLNGPFGVDFEAYNRKWLKCCHTIGPQMGESESVSDRKCLYHTPPMFAISKYRPLRPNVSFIRLIIIKTIHLNRTFVFRYPATDSEHSFHLPLPPVVLTSLFPSP